MPEEPFASSEPPLPGPVRSSPPTPEQMRLIWAAVTALSLLLMVGVSLAVFWGFVSLLSWSYPVLLPIGLAVIIALVLEPVVEFLQRCGLSRRIGTLSSCLGAGIIFILFWIFLLPALVTEGGKLIGSLPKMIDESIDKLENFGADDVTVPATTPPVTNAAPAVTNTSVFTVFNGTNVVATTNVAITPAPPPAPVPHRHQKPPPPRRVIYQEGLRDWVSQNLPAAETSVQNAVAHLAYSSMGPVSQALGFLLGFGFVPIYVYYFLADQKDIAKHWHEYVPLRSSPLRNEVVSVLGEINGVLVRYFRGQIIVASCNGLLTSIGLVAIGVPYGLILGIMTGALSIVPFLGIIASILPALLLAFISSGGWVKPVLVLAVFAIVQMSESMFITPRVQSHSTGLHQLTIILGILFWSMLLPGILGPVVAVPLTCAVVVLLRRYIWDGAGPAGS